jgi:penicillin-binding protein 2
LAVSEEIPPLRRRVLMGVIGAWYLLIVIALISLQLVEGERYASLARENRQYRTRVLAPRGAICDRNGVPLAENEYQARVTIARRHARVGDATLSSLQQLLELDDAQIVERLERGAEDGRVTIVRHADPVQIAKVEEHRTMLPDVQLEVQPRRTYRFGPLAAHLLGYVGEVRSDETQGEGANALYGPGDMIGRAGVEALAEEQLRGRHGRKVVEVNAAGHVVGELPEGNIPSVPGVRLYLTISQPMQSELEHLLAGRVGAGVVIEVATGDILAAASSPSFDPNEFTGGISAPRWVALNDDLKHPLFNRIFQGGYPPGSTYKLITAAAALERRRITPLTRMHPCHGGLQFGNRFFRCWKPEGHGSLDLLGAIAQSCDVYFYQVGQLLTPDELAETAARFGLAARTGIELAGESPGLVPTTSYYDEKLGRRGWGPGVMLNNAIGQGELLVTPLQLARTYAAVGGDGYLYRPNIVLARENVFGVREVRQVRRSAETVCSQEVLDFLKLSMRQAVAGEQGTGSLARVEGIEVSGKTGTAQNPHGQDHAWFVAYAPSEHPEVAVAVIVENAGHGGSVAAPIVGKLLTTYFTWQTATHADSLARATGVKG